MTVMCTSIGVNATGAAYNATGAALRCRYCVRNTHAERDLGQDADHALQIASQQLIAETNQHPGKEHKKALEA